MARARLRPLSGRFLSPDPRVSEPYRMTPQLALRIGILGALVLAVFAVLFLRLWALQVLSGSEYLLAARNNQLRTMRLEAPRGPILDRNAVVLVDNEPGTAVQIWPADLPKRGRYRELRQLARILKVPLAQILRDIERRKNDPLTPVIVKQPVREDEVNYLLERKERFRGVRVVDTYLRRYRFQSLAAHVLGYVGEISPQQLKRRRGYRPGDTIGLAGVEASFDRYLRGRPGLAQLRVDASGRPRSDLEPGAQPKEGQAIRTTIDVHLQRAAERALAEGIEAARNQDCFGCWMSNGGAVVALDPRNGEVLALVSNPSFKPSVYVGRPDPEKLAPLVDERTAEGANYPSLNRATAGLYPPGSTFKPVTAIAAMQERLIDPFGTLECTPDFEAYDQIFTNWTFMYEAMTVPTALAQSCDTFFYRLGQKFYELPEERRQPLQEWAARFGFGRTTGFDVGPESAGLVPTIKWRLKTFEREIDRLWKPGDSIQLAIGQKDLLVTPLQMAVFYSLLANGGKLVTPHVVATVEQVSDDRSPGFVRVSFSPAPKELNIDPNALSVVREGLYQATHASGGTSTAVFGGFEPPIAGKTGTAEKAVNFGTYTDLVDQSWWCGYGPADRTPTIVVCAVIENGGFGGAIAAPTAYKVFAKYFGTDAPPPSPEEAD